MRKITRESEYNFEITGNTLFTYSRKPTEGEIKFGEGAIHYKDFYFRECKKDGSMEIKKRLKCKYDGLIYTYVGISKEQN